VPLLLLLYHVFPILKRLNFFRVPEHELLAVESCSKKDKPQIALFVKLKMDIANYTILTCKTTQECGNCMRSRPYR